MSLFKIFEIASSGVTAQSQRLNATASNLANADSAAGPDGKAYQARQVVFQTVQLDRRDPRSQGVAVQGVIQDPSVPRRVHDPKNPMADDTGYVTLPNVYVAEERMKGMSWPEALRTCRARKASKRGIEWSEITRSHDWFNASVMSAAQSTRWIWKPGITGASTVSSSRASSSESSTSRMRVVSSVVMVV